MLTRPFSWQTYANALVGRGLPPRDAKVLVGRMRRLRARPGPTEPSLLPALASQLPAHEYRTLIAAVVEAQARGPHSRRFAGPWRRLYVAGCPIDHIWTVLWHSFKDPEADSQDTEWVSAKAGMANVERYIELQFPRFGIPLAYGPGLGCEELFAAARAGAKWALRELAKGPAGSTSDVHRVVLKQSIDRSRYILSPELRAQVEAAVGIVPHVIRRPSESAVRKAVLKCMAGKALSPEENKAILSFEPRQDERIEVPEEALEATVTRWFEALDAMFATKRVVHDVAGDRFVAAGEPTTKRTIRARPPPGQPRAFPDALRPLMSRWNRSSEWNKMPLRELEERDPLEWLECVGGMVTAPPPRKTPAG